MKICQFRLRCTSFITIEDQGRHLSRVVKHGYDVENYYFVDFEEEKVDALGNTNGEISRTTDHYK